MSDKTVFLRSRRFDVTHEVEVDEIGRVIEPLPHVPRADKVFIDTLPAPEPEPEQEEQQ